MSLAQPLTDAPACASPACRRGPTPAWSPCCWTRWRLLRCLHSSWAGSTATYCSRSWCTTSPRTRLGLLLLPRVPSTCFLHSELIYVGRPLPAGASARPATRQQHELLAAVSTPAALPRHALNPAQIPALYSGLFSQLAPGGCAVTITRPQEVDYPLFRRAHEVGCAL